MELTLTDIPGVVILTPKIFIDERGYFCETFNRKVFDHLVGDINFVQDNQSQSTYGVIRGLHFQRPPHAQAKLVRCISGAVLDVAVDLRRDSPTYGRHVSCLLTAENHRQLFLPRGMAHGFAVLSPTAVFLYKCDNFYCPQAEGGIDALDPELAIDWQIDPADALLSVKDRRLPSIADFDSPF